MKSFAAAAALVLLVSTTAFAQPASPPASARMLTTVPGDSVTVTNYYKQNVYDTSDNKIGEIMDVLIGQDGKVNALIIGVGGFLGMGEKDVAVPFNGVKGTMKDNKWYLVMNTTKDALKNAPGYKYDKTKTQWVPDAK
jgi:sporulation protein YlmC with PRC-barrel domain